MITGIVKAAGPYLVMVFLCGALWLTWGKLQAQSQLIETQQQHAEQVAQDLRSTVMANDKIISHMQSLLTEHRRVASHYSSQLADFRRLQDEVEEIRVWADMPLPADIVRLRSRPEVTGSQGYGPIMPGRDAVRTERLAP